MVKLKTNKINYYNFFIRWTFINNLEEKLNVKKNEEKKNIKKKIQPSQLDPISNSINSISRIEMSNLCKIRSNRSLFHCLIKHLYS